MVKKTKYPTFEFDNYIRNIDDLLKQLDSLKDEALYMMPSDEVFQKDFHALRITINFIKELKEKNLI